MTYAQPFWDAFRKRLETGFTTWAQVCRIEHWDSETRTRQWTSMIVQSAKEACADLQPLFGCELAIGGERINRLDVHAQNKTTGELLIAYELPPTSSTTSTPWHAGPRSTTTAPCLVARSPSRLGLARWARRRPGPGRPTSKYEDVRLILSRRRSASSQPAAAAARLPGRPGRLHRRRRPRPFRPARGCWAGMKGNLAVLAWCSRTTRC